MATACAERSAQALYSVAQIRAIEHAAQAALPEGTLMQRAGIAVADTAQRLLAARSTPSAGTASGASAARILVAAGPGNNGGDALEAAAHLARRGHQVVIVMPLSPDVLPADAQRALDQARQTTARFITLDSLPRYSGESSWDLAIDGLFGIGLTRPLTGDFAVLTALLNALACPVLAIDVPSGLDADCGTVIGDGDAVVRASMTVSFIGNKPGLHTAQGRDHAGDVIVDSLGIDATCFPAPTARLNDPDQFATALQPRSHASHKGSYGDLFVIGGASGMGGAVLLAARMGAMAGAGRVYAGFLGSAPAFDPQHPELMCRDAATLAATLAPGATVTGAVVVGPGLGQSREANDLLVRVLASGLPAVLDADALNLIAAEPGLGKKIRQRRAPTVLTPHPLEAARLLQTNAAAVQADRLRAASDLAASFQSIVVLKGSGTVIADPSGQRIINPTGNPALATAGTGDVLSGLCGALLAQGCPAWDAALAAVWLHGAAADRMVASGAGPQGITASEFLPEIRAALNQQIRQRWSEKRSPQS